MIYRLTGSLELPENKKLTLDATLKVEASQAPVEPEKPETPTEPEQPEEPSQPEPPITPGDKVEIFVAEDEKKVFTGEEWRSFDDRLKGVCKRIEFFRVSPIITTVPSFKGARVGEYYDVMKRSNEENASHVRVKFDSFTRIETEKKVFISRGKMRKKYAMNFYMELQSEAAMLANWYATKRVDWGIQGSETKKWVDFFRDYGIEPFKQHISEYSPELRKDAWGGENYSFEKLVFDGAIAPPLAWCGAPWRAPSNEYLQNLNALVLEKQSKDSSFKCYAYAMDEPGTGQSGATFQMALDRVKLINEQAPALIPILTGDWSDLYSQALSAGTHDFMFWGVRNLHASIESRIGEHRSKYYGLYGSCMATGNCHNTDNPGPRTTYPVHVVEGNYEDDWKRSLIEAHELGFDDYMHFASTLKLVNLQKKGEFQAREWDKIETFETPGFLRNEGGNGDGTQCYFDDQGPLPSLRMFAYEEALTEITKATLLFDTNDGGV